MFFKLGGGGVGRNTENDNPWAWFGPWYGSCPRITTLNKIQFLWVTKTLWWNLNFAKTFWCPSENILDCRVNRFSVSFLRNEFWKFLKIFFVHFGFHCIEPWFIHDFEAFEHLYEISENFLERGNWMSEIFPWYIFGSFQSWKLLDSLRYHPFSYLKRLTILPNLDGQFSLAFPQKPLEIKLKIIFYSYVNLPDLRFSDGLTAKNEVIDFCFDILKTFYGFWDLDFKFMVSF